MAIKVFLGLLLFFFCIELYEPLLIPLQILSPILYIVFSFFYGSLWVQKLKYIF